MNDQAPEQVEQDNSSRLTKIGIVASVLYLLLIVAFFVIGSHLGIIDWKPVSINEIGDFLAGVFGPLSICWLVLGFFQQGSELRLQVTELRRSVEQQKEMVDVSREALSHDVNMQIREEMENRKIVKPRFVFERAYGKIAETGSYQYIIKMKVTNVGNPVSEVYFSFSPEPDRPISLMLPLWKTGESHEVFVTVNCKNTSGGELTIIYHDANHRQSFDAFRLVKDEQTDDYHVGAQSSESQEDPLDLF